MRFHRGGYKLSGETCNTARLKTLSSARPVLMVETRLAAWHASIRAVLPVCVCVYVCVCVCVYIYACHQIS